MIIAIPTQNDRLDNHFGHCESFTLIELDDSKSILKKETITSTPVCGCKSGLADDLRQKGVELLLAGRIGEGAVKKLKAHHIKVIAGFSGEVNEVIEQWKSNDYSKELKICTAHHNCSH